MGEDLAMAEPEADSARPDGGAVQEMTAPFSLAPAPFRRGGLSPRLAGASPRWHLVRGASTLARRSTAGPIGRRLPSPLPDMRTLRCQGPGCPAEPPPPEPAG